MPRDLSMEAVDGILHPPKTSKEAAILAEKNNRVERKIAAFIAESIQACKSGNGKPALLLRDLLSTEAFPATDDPLRAEMLGLVDEKLTRLRIQFGEALAANGLEPMVEKGILTNEDIWPQIPGKPYPQKTWAKLVDSSEASKLNLGTSRISVEYGKKPTHKFLSPETAYGVSDARGYLLSYYEVTDPKIDVFHVTTAKHDPNKNSISSALSENTDGIDGLEKFMLDIINAMEAVADLHSKGMVHRDLKHENIAVGGVVFDNLSIIHANKLADDKGIFGHPFFRPDSYKIDWKEKITPYFIDTFCLAIDMAEGISRFNEKPEEVNIFIFFKDISKVDKPLSPEEFIQKMRKDLFPPNLNPKITQATQVIEKMILGEGHYSVADAQRDLAEIFGAKA